MNDLLNEDVELFDNIAREKLTEEAVKFFSEMKYRQKEECADNDDFIIDETTNDLGLKVKRFCFDWYYVIGVGECHGLKNLLAMPLDKLGIEGKTVGDILNESNYAVVSYEGLEDD